jgi:hypothetical protein
VTCWHCAVLCSFFFVSTATSRCRCVLLTYMLSTTCFLFDALVVVNAVSCYPFCVYACNCTCYTSWRLPLAMTLAGPPPTAGGRTGVRNSCPRTQCPADCLITTTLYFFAVSWHFLYMSMLSTYYGVHGNRCYCTVVGGMVAGHCDGNRLKFF